MRIGQVYEPLRNWFSNLCSVEVCLLSCVSVFISFYVYLSVCLDVNIHVSICCLYACPSVCLSACPSIFLYIRMPTYASVGVVFCPTVGV